MKSEKSLKKPEEGLIVSLDVEAPEKALDIAEKTRDYADVFKLPVALAISGGGSFIKRIATLRPVFLDLKMFDIPNTMELILSRCRELGVLFVTAHAIMGKRHLAHAASAARRYGIRLLAVTVLTSMTAEDLPPGYVNVDDAVKALAEVARDAGVWGVVCAVSELPGIKTAAPELKTICPGIRPSGFAHQDQKRVSTPEAAGEKGADFIVVGRPVIASENPGQSAKEIREAFFEGKKRK